MNFKLIFTLFLLSLSPTLWAAAIVDIKFSKPSLAYLIAKKELQSKKGYLFNEKIAEQDCLQILSSGYFKSISFKTISKINGVELVFILEANPIPKDILVQGSPIPIKPYLAKYIKTNRPLNFKTLNRALNKTQTLVKEKGFPLFRIEKASLDPNNILKVQSNPGLIKDIQIEGLPTNISKQFQRFLVSKKDSPPQMSLLVKDQEILLSTKLFSYVSPAILIPNSKNEANIVFNTQQFKKNWLDIGLEQLQYENAVGIFYQVNLNRLIHYTDSLSFKQQIQIDSTLQNKQYQLLYRHAILSSFTPILVNYSAYLQEKIESYPNDNQRYDTLRKAIKIKLDYPSLFSFLTVSHSLQSEQVSPRNKSTFTAHKINSINSQIKISTETQSKNYHQGFSLSLNHRLTGKFTGLNFPGISYNRWDSTYEHFHPIRPRHTLAFRINYGKFFRKDSVKTFESEGFLLGGSTTLRGFKENFLYGNQRILSNLEYRWKENEAREWLAFIDFGQADNKLNLLNSYYYNSFGLGIKFNTALAPIRIDLAKGDDLILHFNIGQMF